jgi:DNA-3-methyladenine glycosylase
MNRLDRDFFSREAQIVAPQLLGKLLVRKSTKSIKVGMIKETEAYLGSDDRASHSYAGKTKRNEVMFGEAGFAHVYFTYGMHWLLNIVTEKAGSPSGVLIRAVEPLYDSEMALKEMKPSDIKRLGDGPARLTRWMKIGGDYNKLDVTTSNNLFIVDAVEVGGISFTSYKIRKSQIGLAPRIGVSYAQEDAERPLRFFVK